MLNIKLGWSKTIPVFCRVNKVFKDLKDFKDFNGCVLFLAECPFIA